MLSEDSINKLIEIYIQVDDFCQKLEEYAKLHQLDLPKYNGRLSTSEMLSIIIFYQYSGYKCFQYYYERCVRYSLSSWFPNQISRSRFLTVMNRFIPHLYLFLKWQCSQSKRSQVYFIDSKKLPVCHNRRIHQHKVFKGIANRGKSSTGWFYGFKAHLVINNWGEIINFELSAANHSDNNTEVLKKLLNDLTGHCYGDKGYLSSLFEYFLKRDLKIVSKLRKNMKNKLLPLHEKLWLMKRAVIESVNAILMSTFDIDHTRHRSPANALVHMMAALIGYNFLERKPCVDLPNLLN